MGYDRGDSFSFDFEPNRNPFGSKTKGNCQHDHIPFNLKGNGNIVFSVNCTKCVPACGDGYTPAAEISI